MVGGALLRLNIPNIYLNGDPDVHVDMDFETFEWTPISNIKLNTSDGFTSLHGMSPDYNSSFQEQLTSEDTSLMQAIHEEQLAGDEDIKGERIEELMDLLRLPQDQTP